MKRATLTSSPPSPTDHRSLEHIALHPQLGVLRAQPLEFFDVAADRPSVPSRASRARATQLPNVPSLTPQVTSDLGDRVPRLLDDPDRSLSELPVVLFTDLWHRYPL